MSAATDLQMSTILAMAFNATAREMMDQGVTLTREQADSLGCDHRMWLRDRLGLQLVETHDGAMTMPTGDEPDDEFDTFFQETDR